MDLEHDLGDCIDWMRSDHDELIDPVVAAGMAHYQFEARRADYFTGYNE